MTRRIGKGPSDIVIGESGRAEVLELSGLYREALRHGLPKIWTSDIRGVPKHVCSIRRALGNSELTTASHWEDTPERALLKAIEDAEAWGLPLLEPTSCGVSS